MRRQFIATFVIFSLGCGIGTPMHGEKLGTIIRVAYGGVLCNTWEATIVRGGMNAGSGAFAAPFDFTIESPELADQVQALMEAQREVKLTYRTEGIYQLCRSDSGGHFAVKVEAVK